MRKQELQVDVVVFKIPVRDLDEVEDLVGPFKGNYNNQCRSSVYNYK